MNLYRVMVVDDEEEIRMGIIKKIDWEASGFVVVGDAENGKDALEKAEKLNPDIVMTDIKMPFMDGLELGKALSEVMPSTKVIIFSGSDDFEYAQKAIKINVIEYVLKPINSVELVEVLRKLKTQLDREYDEKRNIEKLYNHYIESLPVIREQFLVGTIEGRIGESQWKEQGENLGIDFKEKYLTVALIHGDSSWGLEETLMSISIKKVVDDNMSNYCNYISFLYSDMVVIIGALEEKEDILKFVRGLNDICKLYERIMSVKISAGVGHICNTPQQMRYSYRAAQNALDYRVMLGTGKAIYIEDVESHSSIQLQLDEQDERAMLNSIKISSKKEIVENIDKLFQKVEDLLLPFN